MRQIISLNGTWRGLPALSRPIGKRELGQPPGDDWLPIRVPSHWQTQKGFGTNDSVVYYKTTFTAPQRTASQAILLDLQGVFYSAEIWLNGHLVGRHNSYFSPFTADITDLLQPDNNVVCIKAKWPLPNREQPGTGAFGTWAGKPSGLHPGGIWRDVNLHIVDEVYITDVKVDTNLTAFDTANINLAVSCQARAAGECVLDYILTPYNFSGEEIRGTTTRQLKKGENIFNIRFAVNKPQLWWPWERGEPNLYQLTVRTSFDNKMTDRYSTRLGIRKVGLQNGHLTINGQSIFLRGANYPPTDIHLGKAVRKDLERDVQYLLDANLNCLRVYDHVALPELYDICNENGILVIQDLTLEQSKNRQAQPTTKEQFISLVNVLKTHPCICAWYLRRKRDSNYANRLSNLIRSIIHKNSHSSSRLLELIKQEDATRPVLGPANRTQFRRLKKRTQGLGVQLNFVLVDRKLRTYVVEYGLPAFPGTATMSRLGAARNVRDINWDKITDKLKADREYFARHLPWDDYDLASTYYMATQRYQAQALKSLHELFRIQKYRPWAGCLLHFLVDCAPVVSSSVLDYWRRAKLGYYTSQSAMQPVLIMADWPQLQYSRDDLLELKLYAINDTPTIFMASAALWRLKDPDGHIVAKGRHVVDLLGDSVVPAGIVNYYFPTDAKPGTYTLELVLELPTREQIENSYYVQVAGIQAETLE